MNFIFDRNSLLKEISTAQEIISTKNIISILSNVLLIAENNSLTIKATDIKVNFTTKIPIELIEEGSATIYCDKFQSILSSLPEGNIEFNQQDTKITITPTAKKVKFNLKSIASDKFPEFIQSDNEQFFDINSRDLRKMINQTVFAISDDETRYFMNGVYLEKKDNDLVMVATDGRRLAYIKQNIEGRIPDFNGIIIPPKILNFIYKRSSDEGLISIAISEKNIFFKFLAYEISSVLINGQFPNYERVIPEKQEKKLVVNKNEFMEALKRVSLLVEQKSHRIYVSVASGAMTITSEESDMGTAREEIPCRYEGEDETIALNCLYLEEPVKVLGSSELKIEFTEPMKAVTLKPEPEAEYFHIIMPMQIE